MKNIKALSIILLAACFIGVFIIVVLNMKGRTDDPIAETPVMTTAPVIKGNGVDRSATIEIFKQISGDQHEALEAGGFVSADENGTVVYSWALLEDLLHREPEDMEIRDYVVLMQLLQGMTVVHADGTESPDCRAIEQLVQKGWGPGGLTLTAANLCTLYKEWVEEILLDSPDIHLLFSGTLLQEEKNMREHWEEELLKAGILIGILMADSRTDQRDLQETTQVPEIRIDYQRSNPESYSIRVGDQTVEIYRFYGGRYGPIGDLARSPSISKIKKDELVQLMLLTYAYDMGGIMIVSEDYTVQMVSCFNDTELEIRAHAYGRYMYEINDITKGNVQYLDITGSQLKAQLEADEPTELMRDYLAWYKKGEFLIESHKRRLHIIFDNYKDSHGEFSGKRIENLTPAQIIKLDNKLRANERGEAYELNLSDEP